MKSSIPYKEINTYYAKVMTQIFDEIKEMYPNPVNNPEYSEDYHEAVGWLDEAGWRGAEINLMKRYYDEPDFKYFGLEHLHDIRSRIENYLNETSIQFRDAVYDYQKYDSIVNKRMDFINDPVSHEKFMKYYNLMSVEMEYRHVSYFVENIQDNIMNFKEELKDLDNKAYNHELKKEFKKILESYKSIKDYVELKYSIK